MPRKRLYRFAGLILLAHLSLFASKKWRKWVPARFVKAFTPSNLAGRLVTNRVRAVVRISSTVAMCNGSSKQLRELCGRIKKKVEAVKGRACRYVCGSQLKKKREPLLVCREAVSR